MSEDGIVVDNKRFCVCGCGHLVRFPRRFRPGHNVKGLKRSAITRARLAESKKGERNPNWLSIGLSDKGIHSWVRRHFIKPSNCELCTSPGYDWANISGKYLRDLTDWQYLCRRCHMLSDGRMNNLNRGRRRRYG